MQLDEKHRAAHRDSTDDEGDELTSRARIGDQAGATRARDAREQ